MPRPRIARGAVLRFVPPRKSRSMALMLDFYLIVSDYRGAYTTSAGWPLANRLIPPNVFLFRAWRASVAKYAVLSEADFHRL
jgi:hypothetical protein